MVYSIKSTPGDFVVKEVFQPETGQGRFAYYRLTKRGWTTQSAVEQVSRAFRKRLKYINFSGNKDKLALTEQCISILHGPRKGLELQGGDIRLEYLGQGRQRINLGSFPGNRFEITVRGLARGTKPREIRSFPNYFDEQRFGRNLNNHLIGLYLVKGDFRAACELIPETRGWLEKSPRDFVGALRSLPKRVLRLYPHSYQSWLWNLAASSYIEGFPHRKVPWALGGLAFPEEQIRNRKIPILGYETRIPSGLRPLIRQITGREGVSLPEFRLRQFPEFDLSGGERDLLVRMRDFDISSPKEDDMNPGRKRVRVSFLLQSGSYATMAIRFIFS